MQPFAPGILSQFFGVVYKGLLGLGTINITVLSSLDKLTTLPFVAFNSILGTFLLLTEVTHYIQYLTNQKSDRYERINSLS